VPAVAVAVAPSGGSGSGGGGGGADRAQLELEAQRALLLQVEELDRPLELRPLVRAHLQLLRPAGLVPVRRELVGSPMAQHARPPATNGLAQRDKQLQRRLVVGLARGRSGVQVPHLLGALVPP
jgi:hypothetical protein